MAIRIWENLKAKWRNRKISKMSSGGFETSAPPSVSDTLDKVMKKKRHDALVASLRSCNKHKDSARGIAFIRRFMHNAPGTGNRNIVRARNIQGFCGVTP